MDAPYEALRQQAREKRDKFIQAAQQEYRVAVRRIRSLHKMMTGEYHPALQPIKSAKEPALKDTILELLPHNEAFTIAQIVERAYSHEVACRYKENSIRSAFGTLKGLGLIKQVGRTKGHIQWARVEADLEPPAFGTMSLCEIAAQLIGEFGPMRFNEIVARMKERGYRPEEPPQVTYDLLRRAMVRYSGRFEKDGDGRWGVVRSV